MTSLGKIILIGMPGSGKTTLGLQLSKSLNLPFRDLDLEIEKGEGFSIKEIFEQQGEAFFRKIERQYLHATLSDQEDFILASGGGTPCFYNNITQLLKAGKVIYLEADLNTLIGRLNKENVASRPLLREDSLEAALETKLDDRAFYYTQAHHTVKVNDSLLDRVLALLKEETNSKGN